MLPNCIYKRRQVLRYTSWIDVSRIRPDRNIYAVEPHLTYSFADLIRVSEPLQMS